MNKALPSIAVVLLLVGASLFSGCAKKDKEGKSLTEKKALITNKSPFEELANSATASLAKKNKQGTVEILEKMMEEFPEHADIHQWRLKLGDLHYELRNYEKGDICYKTYRKLNPSAGEYASYRSILCTLNQTLSPEHDQTLIHKTISRCNRHLENTQYKLGKYAQEVKDIKYTCEQKLIDREFYVLKFYMRQGQYKAAENRLKYIRDNFLSKREDIEDRVLYCESKLAAKQNKKEEADEKREMLFARHPQSPYAERLRRASENPPSQFIFA